VTKSSIPLEDIVPSGDIGELTELTKRRKDLLKGVHKAEKVEMAAITRARAKKTEKTKPLQEELKNLDARLAKILLTRKRSLWARFGKTIKTPYAVIRYRTDSASLDTPRNTSAIVNFLLRMRRGNRYLTWTPSLNRDVITNSSVWTQRLLRPLGVWVGRHAIITIKTTGEDEPTTLDRRRYPNRL
jgi:hypothetical protein